MISFVFDRAFHGIQCDILDPYMRLILFGVFSFEKMWNFLGGYGRIGEVPIGVYRRDTLEVEATKLSANLPG